MAGRWDRRGYAARRRKNKRFVESLIVGLFIFALIGAGIQWLWESGVLLVVGLALAVIGVFYGVKTLKKKARRRELLEKIKQFDFDDSPESYIINTGDFERGTSRELLYRKRFKLKLLEVYQNRCARCGSQDNGLDIDHFFIPKSEGGMFGMIHRDGYAVNNAIPLCQPCNRSKSNKSYLDFFKPDEIESILKRNSTMNEFVNEQWDIEVVA